MNSLKAKQDLGLSIFIYVLVAFFFAQTVRLKAEDSKIFPYIILALFLCLNTILFFHAVCGLLRAKPAQGAPVQLSSWKQLLVPFLAFAGITVYVALYQLTNYFIATAIMIPVYLLLMRVRPWQKILLITGGYLVFIYVLFVLWLHVRLL